MRSGGSAGRNRPAATGRRRADRSSGFHAHRISCAPIGAAVRRLPEAKTGPRHGPASRERWHREPLRQLMMHPPHPRRIDNERNVPGRWCGTLVGHGLPLACVSGKHCYSPARQRLPMHRATLPSLRAACVLDQIRIAADHGIKGILPRESFAARGQSRAQARVGHYHLDCAGKCRWIIGVDEHGTRLPVVRQHLAQHLQIIGDYRNAGVGSLDRRQSKRLGDRGKNEDVERFQEIRNPFARQFSDKDKAVRDRQGAGEIDEARAFRALPCKDKVPFADCGRAGVRRRRDSSPGAAAQRIRAMSRALAGRMTGEPPQWSNSSASLQSRGRCA